MNLSFKQYLNEIRQDNPNYFNKLKDEFGIKSDAIKGNHWLPNVTLGDFTYNGIVFNYNLVKNGKGEVVGAKIKPIKTQNAYKQIGDKMVRYPDNNVDLDRERFVNLQDLQGMMNPQVK